MSKEMLRMTMCIWMSIDISTKGTLRLMTVHM